MADAVANTRVSSKSQDFATQRDAIERAATARGDVIAAWYSEKQSGQTTARAELQRLRNDARRGLVRKLYVYRLDRLTRSGIRDTLEVVKDFRTHGCELVTIADGFDVNGPASEIILAVMAWAAKMERLATNERIASARERIEAEGGRWGRPRRFGPADVAKAQAMRAEGRSVREIAVALKTPRSTVARALRASQKDTRAETA